VGPDEVSLRALLTAAGSFLNLALELRDQSREGFRLLVGGEMAARQALDLKTGSREPLLREIDLTMLERIFVATANQEWESIAIGVEELSEVEAIALRFVIGYETRSCCEEERSIMAV
jgi:hypothetical protein